MVNPEPNESSIYSKVRKALAAQKGAVPTDTFQSIVAQAHKDALGAPSISLFDLKKNPYERTDCTTSDPAESCNLYDVAAYADVCQGVDVDEKSWPLASKFGAFLLHVPSVKPEYVAPLLDAYATPAALKAALDATHVAVEDLSDGCGAKLKITIVSAKFEGLPLLKQHRLVNDAAKDELSAVHAFNLKTFTPAKWAAAASK